MKTEDNVSDELSLGQWRFTQHVYLHFAHKYIVNSRLPTQTLRYLPTYKFNQFYDESSSLLSEMSFSLREKGIVLNSLYNF